MSYLDRFRIDGKVAVVTGGARGIGYAVCEALSEAGAAVVIADIDGDRAKDAARRLGERGGRVAAVQMDVTQPESVEDARNEVAEMFGTVDILVNNAGISKSFEPAETMSDQAWLSVLDVNLNGLFWCCRSFARAMLERGSGVIVNVGSMSGEIVNRPQEQSQYNASKAAVHHLTRSLAAEWGSRGVRVNAVAPTYIATEMLEQFENDDTLMEYWRGGTPMDRFGRADEIAAVVLFLASNASSLMTGSIVLADGGYTCW